VYLAALGPRGLREVRQLCHSKARTSSPGSTPWASSGRHPGPAAVQRGARAADGAVHAALGAADAAGILAGYAVGEHFPDRADSLLIAVTERRTRAEIDRLVEVLAQR
jgi:glycine dehydrogenase subunit 1